MAGARKKCPKCGAGNEGAATTCSLCGQNLPAGPGVNRTTMEAFELEPRQWNGSTQRRRGDKDTESAGAVVRPSSPPPPAPSEGHYLLPPVGPPLKLEQTVSSVVFGRDEGCSVRISSAKVSRRHAELRWRGTPPQVVLRDLNSQNGTYLNDAKITGEVALNDGDTIRMGDYIASYRYLGLGEDVSMLGKGGGDTAVMETVVVYPEAKTDGGALTGDAAILPIHEVLRRLLALHAHGVLVVEVAGTKGEMKLVDGKAVSGSYAGLEDSVAIQAMASLNKGRFRFDPDPNAPPMRATPATTRITPTSNDGTPPQATPPAGRPPARPAAGHSTPPPRPVGAPPPRPMPAPGAARPSAPPAPGAPRPAPRPPGT